MAWLLTRGFVVLGGAVAGTAVAWAVAAGSASAGETPSGPLGLGQHAAATLEVVDDAAEAVAGVLPAKAQAADAVDAVRAAEPLRLSQSTGTAQQLLPAQRPQDEETAPPKPAQLADAQNTATEVAAAAARDALAPDGASTARLPRTTSGDSNGPLSDPDDAPPAHAPASVPPLPAPSAAASSAGLAGSSLLPALLGQLAAGELLNAGDAVVVPAADGGRPDTTGAQPGTEPD